jgi:predicted dehydrogenase/threonine dehydrogenase-like Zn-dependent dehydrogenase
MKQVCLSGGQIAVLEVPAPACAPGGIVVRTSHSLISTGTELSATGGGGRENLLMKAVRNPHLVKKVLEKVGTAGVRQTVDLVRARTSASIALGYSSAGEVVEVGEGVTAFKRGDRVACAGAGYANHAEYNFVPVQLASAIPPPVDYASASFATLGAIALQGVRRLDPTLGEQIVVLGLGLLGQITAQLLKANGCRVFGVDLLPARVDLARGLGMEEGLRAGETDPSAGIMEWTNGAGADGVIVCASGGNVGLLNRSFDLCRRKGRVVLVGDVPIRIAREKIYKKELDFFISCSYGPGRYDRGYEEQGIDYPLAYVRWTEGRNLAEVLRLMASGDLQVAPLVGKTYRAEDAPEAYASLQTGERPIAVLLDYGLTSAPSDAAPGRTVRVAVARSGEGKLRLGVVGAGGFFRGVHLPAIEKHGHITIATIASRTGLSIRDLAAKYNVPHVTTDPEEIFRDPDIDAVLIATRHNLHAPLAIAAARAGKHVFVEKPMGLSVEECDRILAAVQESGVLLAVGFNRRFSPHARAMKAALDRARGPKTVIYRINAGPLPADHWLHDPREGGGRLVGEGVHFFDFARWLVGTDPVSVSADAVVTPAGADADNIIANVRFADGSVAAIAYVSSGHPGARKERVEAFGGGCIAVLDDYRSVEIHGGSPMPAGKSRVIEKGHAEILDNFYKAVRGSEPLGVTATDGYWATWCAEKAIRSLARHTAE